jgi:hypothetical protein
MPIVAMTPHLYRFFPMLENRHLEVPPGSVAQVLQAINTIAPGFCDYVLDDQGALRKHVKICVNDAIVVDRKNLSDQVQQSDKVFIFQALTGG